MKHPKLWLLVCALILLGTAACSHKRDYSGIKSRLDKSVAAVYAGNTMGTGFFIGKTGEKPQYIITNYQVVENLIAGDSLPEVEICYGLTDSEHDCEYAAIVDYTEEKNLALIRLPQPAEKKIPLLLLKSEDSEVEIGASIYLSGYTEYEYGQIFRSGNITSLTRRSAGTAATVGADLYFTDGIAGAPIVNEQCSVVAVARKPGNEFDSGELMEGIHVSELSSWLQEKEIPFSYWENTPNQHFPFNLLAWVSGLWLDR